MILWVPTPAIEGSNVPLIESVIPFPLQVPPLVAADRLNELSVTQTGFTEDIVGSEDEITTKFIVSLFEQMPEVV